MDKYEFNIKVEQIKKMVSKGDYATAMKITDTIDWKRVRNTNLLSLVAEVYEKNEDYQEAKNILLLAFERAPIGKRLLYKLAELALKENNIAEAEAYYREFCDLSPDDARQHLLRYLILKAKGAPTEQLIHSLEGYTTLELEEKWLYELAKLYQKAGREGDCVTLCDKIMLMFGLGKYVDKAMELKLQYAPLTSYQMDLVENRDKYEAKLRAVEQAYSAPGGILDQEDYDDESENIEDSPQQPTLQPEYQEHILDEELAARMKEAEVEEELARSMSNISNDDMMAEENPAEQTRILADIRTIMPTMDIADMAGRPSVLERSFTLGEAMDASNEEESAAWAETSATKDLNFISEEPVIRRVFVSNEDQNTGNMPMAEPSAQAESDDFPEIEELEEEPNDKITNHLMIEARTPERGLEVALETLRQIHKEIGTKNPVVKISGAKLNKRGIFALADKLAGKDLIVEEAGDLSGEVLDELNEFMTQDTTGLIVILIDNPRQLEELHNQNPSLARKFECIGSGEIPPVDEMTYMEDAIQKQAEQEAKIARETVMETPIKRTAGVYSESLEKNQDSIKTEMIKTSVYQNPIRQAPVRQEPIRQEPIRQEPIHQEPIRQEPVNQHPIPEKTESNNTEMDIDEFAQYACKYATEIDCSITGKSMLALYERIEIMEEDGIALTRENAENVIEEAADKAEKPSIGKMITGIFSSKYNKDGLLILKEEHFID